VLEDNAAVRWGKLLAVDVKARASRLGVVRREIDPVNTSISVILSAVVVVVVVVVRCVGVTPR